MCSIGFVYEPNFHSTRASKQCTLSLPTHHCFMVVVRIVQRVCLSNMKLELNVSFKIWKWMPVVQVYYRKTGAEYLIS